MSAETSFAALEGLYGNAPGITTGVAFASPALKVGGKIFTMNCAGELVFKLPAERCDGLVARGAARPFESGKRKMREWVALADPDEAEALRLADEALAFVEGGDFRTRVTLRAPAGSVYRALTTPDGLRGWWSADADVGTEVGERIRFNWSASDYTEMRVDGLDPDVAVDWTCVAQHDRNLPDPREWVGTTLSFRLSPRPDGATRLDFVHRGLRPKLDCYDACENGWAYFLGRSLRGLVETGSGLPWAA